MEIFRAVPAAEFEEGEIKLPYLTRRLPRNIPYYVDNLWEFNRPEWAPSRRFAVYGSPTKELALKNASAGGLARTDYVACRLEFKYPPKMIQLSVPDAREHEDVGRLSQIINSKLRTWADTGLAGKLPLAPLFLPVVAKSELEEAMQADSFLKHVLDEASAAILMWSEYPHEASLEGEFFFEMGADNHYRLFKA